MDREGAKFLRAKFLSGIKEAEDMIEMIRKHMPKEEDVYDEGIRAQLQAIDNYSRSVAFIDRYYPDLLIR